MKKGLLMMLVLALPATGIAAHFSENELGKLFTTPVQRQKIDAFRKGKSIGAVREQVSPSDVKIQGLVKRSDGKSVVWLNGQNTLNSSHVGGVRASAANKNIKSDKVRVTINNKTVRLKPGEVWSEETNQVTDTY